MYNLESSFQHGMWDLCWESGVISETLKRPCVDICCLQEARWKGQRAKMIGNGFKFLWSPGCKAENGVGVIVINWLIGKVVGAERVNDEGEYCYWGCSLGGSIFLLATGWLIMDKVVTSEKVLVGGDLNGDDMLVGDMLVVIWVVLERFMGVWGLDK